LYKEKWSFRKGKKENTIKKKDTIVTISIRTKDVEMRISFYKEGRQKELNEN